MREMWSCEEQKRFDNKSRPSSVHRVGMKLVSLLLVIFSGLNVYGQTKLDQEEYEVYKTILNEIYRENKQTYANKSHFVVLQKTKTDPELNMDFVSTKYKFLIELFITTNQAPAIVEYKLPFETYYLVTEREIGDLFKLGEIESRKRRATDDNNDIIQNPGTEWKPFYRKYPEASGYYSISRVAFDPNGSLAMAHVRRDDIHSGFSNIYILKKQKTEWRIVEISSRVWSA